MNRSDQRRVVVTGYGAICALGNNVSEIWSSIMNYQTGYHFQDFGNPNISARYFGFIKDKPRYKNIPKPVLKFLPEFARLSFYAANEAVQMAFGQQQPADHYDPFDCGVIFGTGWGAQDESTRENATYRDEQLAYPFSNLLVMPNVATAAISMHWNLRGYQNTPVAACATGSIAIGDAFEKIRSGKAKMVLAGGGESITQGFSVWSIDTLRALSKEKEDIRKACCPFSADRSGFVLSEGAAVLCLEDYDSAVARGASILAEITGYGSYSDARDITSPAEDMLARIQCVRTAMQQAGLPPDGLQYINAHGTSTQLNDLNETNTLKLALGEAARRTPASSTKSYTGHLIAAAGAIESIFSIRTLETGMMPATIHLDRPDDACDLDYIPHEHRHATNIEHVMNINYGFGGANSALIFSKV